MPSGKQLQLTIVFLLIAVSAMAEASVSLSPAEYDFGQTMQGEIVEGLFTVSLEGEDSAKIKVLAGCSCMTVSPGNFTLTSESAMDVFWTLDSTKYSGHVSFDVIVLTDSNREIYKIQGNIDSSVAGGNRLVFWIILLSVLLLLVITSFVLIKRKISQSKGKMAR